VTIRLPDHDKDDRVSQPLYDSVEAMLAPEMLGAIVGREIGAVREAPLGAQESAYSGSAISVIETNTDRLLLKRCAPAWDYFMRVSNDGRGREALVFTSGLLDRLPPELAHAYLACARDGDGWAILMRDVASSLMPPRVAIAHADHRRVLTGLAAFHAAFWEHDPGPGFCAPWHHYHVVSPAAAAGDAGEHGALQEMIQDGWERLLALIDPGIGTLALALANDPTPLTDRLARLPQTVVHGDMRPANIGIEDDRLLPIDWALVGRGVAGLDAIWYVAGLGARSPLARESSLDIYRAALADRLGPRFDTAWWEPMLDFSLLGGLLRHGWIAARVTSSRDTMMRDAARADLSWWTEAARRGIDRL
jgi:hypothetical protein